MKEYGSEFEPDLEDREEGVSQEILDDIEAELYDLSGVDEKIVKDILKTASANFEKNSGKWQSLLITVKEAIENNRKGEFEDEEAFTAFLQDQSVEANELVEH